jgi:hypothetical protein
LNAYTADRAFSDRFLPAICAAVGPRLLVPAPFELDCKQATDLVVLTARNMAIAARVRKWYYSHGYPCQFTIRAHRDSGAETELSKIVAGFGDWLFYGFSNKAGDGSGFALWYIIDLHVFRAFREGVPMTANGDGTHFCAYDIGKFPRELIIASWADDRLSKVLKKHKII